MIRTGISAAAVLIAGTAAHAWDAHGHRTVALLAVDVMTERMSSSGDKDSAELDWLFTPDSRLQVGYEAGEPDRYRAINIPQLKHENDPDHYIDAEDLAQFGLTLQTIPPLRYEYIKAMAVSKYVHPEMITKPYNEKMDTARTGEWPGMLPYSIMEHYGKLVSSYRQIRVLDALKDPARDFQVTAARANCIFEMGQLAHFVGDAAQPLHTTMHHHGWFGDNNPNGYTTNKGIHAYIDTTVLGIHGFSYETLKGACTVRRTVDAHDPWKDVLEHIQRSFEKVEPLYALQKSGDLDRGPGKELIQERLCDGAAMLGAMYAAAWTASAMTSREVQDFINYDRKSAVTPNPMDRKPVGTETARPNP